MIDEVRQADTPATVAQVYEDGDVAAAYLDKRLRFAWQRLLHRRQLACLQAVIDANGPVRVLEFAPGPARLSAELSGVSRGVMLENSASMARIARKRLTQKQLDSTWTVLEGDAFAADALLGDERFDLAFSFRFIRHFREADRIRLYGQLSRALKPRGLLVFDVVNSVMRRLIDGDVPPARPGELSVYDETYTPERFRSEMRSNGFETIRMVPVVRRFPFQARLSHRLDGRTPRIADALVELLEVAPSREPLEWVAVCRKSSA